MRRFSLLAMALLASCGSGGAGNQAQNAAGEPPALNDVAAAETMANEAALPAPVDDSDIRMNATANAAEDAPLNPPAPGEPGGLPDDRTPISEAPFTETSAQGAANVLQTYYALLGEKNYADAWRLWSDGGKSSGMSQAAFAASFDKYRQYRANVGAPGTIGGAAGSLYVEVPVQVYGRLKSGQEFNMLGPVTLRRCNNVPGCTAEQKKWRISSSGVKPRPKG